MRNIPNLITLARLVCVPVLVWLIISGDRTAAFWLFVAAGASDALDGFIAKRWNFITELGQILDPIADKALLVSTYVALAWAMELPDWLVILVVSRDILIVGAFSVSALLGHKIEVRPLVVSKINTGLQIALAALAIADNAFGFGLGSAERYLGYAVAITTILSGGAYMTRWLKELTEREKVR